MVSSVGGRESCSFVLRVAEFMTCWFFYDLLGFFCGLFPFLFSFLSFNLNVLLQINVILKKCFLFHAFFSLGSRKSSSSGPLLWT